MATVLSWSLDKKGNFVSLESRCLRSTGNKLTVSPIPVITVYCSIYHDIINTDWIYLIHSSKLIVISAMSGRKPSDVESEQENERDSQQIEMVKNMAQEADETSAELVVVSDGLREKREVETGEKAEKRARKGKPLEGFG